MQKREALTEAMQRASLVMLDNPLCSHYDARHGVEAAPVLTVCEDPLAEALAERLAPRITGKVVVEIGGGIGLLACHMAHYAKRVFCIEANPIWAETFGLLLFESKPKNLSYLFGAADEFAGVIHGDVAVFASHSGVRPMTEAGQLFAPLVIDIYGEMIAANPDKFDTTATWLRKFV